MFVELQSVEEYDQLVHRHHHEVGDVPAADADIKRLFAQAAAPAFGTGRLARIARLHHAELDFPPLRVDVGEKLVQTVEILVAAPQQPFLLLRQLVKRRMNREIELIGVLHQLFLPFAHGLAPPAGDGVLVDGLALVGNHQILVDADHLAVSLAAGTCPQRVVEAEKVFRRMFEFDAVRLEARREFGRALVRDDGADAVAVGEGARHGVADAGLRVVVRRDAHAVDHDLNIRGSGRFVDRGEYLLDQARLTVGVDSHQAVGEQQRQFFDDPLPFGQHERRGDDGAAPLAQFLNVCRHVVHAVAAHLLSRYGREGVSDAGEQQFQVVVYLGRRAHRRTGVARIDLLFDGDGRRDARDDVHVGFVDFAQKLPGIGRKALDVAALSLGEDGVEGQRRFSRTRKARYDDQFVVRNLDLDVLEVVDPRAFDIDGFFVCHFVSLKPRNAADRISGFRFLTFDSQMSSPAMLPPAFFSFSVSSPARLSRMVSTIVQRLSNSCDAILGCCSLITRMMSFMAM